MTSRVQPLKRAYAWQFLVACALLATMLALLAAFAVTPQAPTVASPQGTFSLAKLAEATAAAPKAEEPDVESPKPAPRKKAERAAPPAVAAPPATPAPPPAAAPPVAAAAPAAAAASAAAEPIRPVPPNPQISQATPPTPSGASQYGATLRGEIVVDEMKVPLPDGQWRVAADIRSPSSHDLALAREADKLIGAVVIVSYNTSGNGVGYNAAAACSRRAMRGVTEKNEDFGEQSCWSSALVRAKGTVENLSKSAVGRAARGDLEGRGLTFTSEAVLDTWIVHANANRRILLAVYYNPEVDGFEPIKLDRIEESPWNAKNLAQNPQHAKWLRERLQWASQAYQRLKQGFAAASN